MTTTKKNIMKVGDATIRPMAKGEVKITLGGKSTTIPYKDLWGAVFMLGEGKYRDEMLPVQKKEMMVFSRQHAIQLKNDMKAGEVLKVWCEVNVEKTVVESIAEKNGAKVIYQVEEEVIPTPESAVAPVEKGVE